MNRTAASFWVALYLLLGIFAAARALQASSNTSPEVFLARDDPVRENCRRFREEFGDDAFVVVTARQGNATREEFQRSSAKLRAALAASDGVDDVLDPAASSPLSRALRLESPTGDRRTYLVALTRPDSQTIASLQEIASRFPNMQVGVAGPPVLRTTLDAASDTVGRTLFPLLVLVMGLLVWMAYRNVVIVAVLLGTTGLAVLGGVAIVAQEPLNLVTILLPVILLALGVALGIHLMHAYRRALENGEAVSDAVRSMLRAEWRPCLVTSLTTASGFGAFAFARIEPLRLLGIAMAGGILGAFVIFFTLLPSLLVLLQPRPREGLRISGALVRWVPRWVVRRRLVLTAAGSLLVAAIIALPSIERETNGLHYLPESHPLRQETERLQAAGVGTVTVEIVVQIDEASRISELGVPLRELELRAEQMGGAVRGIVTPLTVAAEAATRLGLSETSAIAFAWSLSRAPPPVETKLRRFRDPEKGVLRVSLRMDPVGVREYGRVTAEFEQYLQQTLGRVPGVSWQYTGEFPIIMTVQAELLDTLLWSLITACGTILIVLSIALRSVPLAVLTLLPAAIPLAFVVLASALFGVPLSIATVMVLSVTLGIVTDDSVHMIHAWREGHPLPEVLRRVGTAVTETSLAILLGFLVCGASSFLPTRYFGLLTAGAMAVALFADLVLFPAILDIWWRSGRRVRTPFPSSREVIA